MYVCVCNAITDRDVRASAQCDACTVAGIYRSLGRQPKCGKCVPLVRQLLRQVTEIAQPQHAAAAG
jgi:bacterioferritin-associated ferredoxin